MVFTYREPFPGGCTKSCLSSLFFVVILDLWGLLGGPGEPFWLSLGGLGQPLAPPGLSLGGLVRPFVTFLALLGGPGEPF